MTEQERMKAGYIWRDDGENSVIGAGSVVTRDVPANVIAFGVPCKVYRQIDGYDAEHYFKDRRFDEQPER